MDHIPSRALKEQYEHGPFRAAAWLLLRFACGRRLVEGLDVHRDGGRPGRSRAHVGDEHVRALRVAGGKTPVGVERADEGGVTRVPVYAVHVQLRTHMLERARVRRGDLHLRRHHQLHPEAAALRSGRGRGHINVRAAQGRHDVAIVLPQPSDDRVDEHRGVALPATHDQGRATHARSMPGHPHRETPCLAFRAPPEY
eukprot:scaffold22015_cov78-Phaeocystis_antarctica.AAC.7